MYRSNSMIIVSQGFLFRRFDKRMTATEFETQRYLAGANGIGCWALWSRHTLGVSK